MQGCSYAGTLMGGGGGRLGASPTAQGPAKWTAALDSRLTATSKAGSTAPIERPAFEKRQPAWVGTQSQVLSSTGGGGGGLPGPSFLLLDPYSPASERLQPERQPQDSGASCPRMESFASSSHRPGLPLVQHHPGIHAHDLLW